MVGGCRGYVVGGCRGYVVGEIKIKAKLSPAGAGTWAELGNNGHFDALAHTLHSDQKDNIKTL